jgi:hypothetical protein
MSAPPGMTPTTPPPLPPRAAIVPATWVPCATRSSDQGKGQASAGSMPALGPMPHPSKLFPARSGCPAHTPLSMMHTVTPRPAVRGGATTESACTALMPQGTTSPAPDADAARSWREQLVWSRSQEV